MKRIVLGGGSSTKGAPKKFGKKEAFFDGKEARLEHHKRGPNYGRRKVGNEQ